MATTALMIFLDFSWFREQTCIVACPYGRFQSVMLDRQSLIITYDEERGEPRGRARRRDDGDLELPRIGDCVDCHLCVTTCPTGIDIRNGLQMECIGCAQCIDACDAVMDKLGRPRGLVRYSSQATMEHAPRRLLRLRVVLYPLLLAVILAAFGAALIARDPVDLTLLRGANTAYVRTADGLIANAVRVKIVNRDRVAHGYTLEVDGLAGARLETEQPFPVRLGPGEGTTIAGRIVVPDDAFTVGRARVTVRIRDDASYSNELTYRLQGPWGAAGAGGDG
jgi:cytochrome c oxidase accessory protein FixG